MGEITGNIDHPTTIGGYLGLILLSISYVAIGVLASSLSKNQVIAFLLALFFNFLIYLGISYLAVFLGNPLDYYIIKLKKSVCLFAPNIHFIRVFKNINEFNFIFFRLLNAFINSLCTNTSSGKINYSS